MHQNLIAVVGSHGNDQAINIGLEDVLSCYLFDNDDMFEDEECTGAIIREWERYLKDDPLAIERYPTWQDYLKRYLADDYRIDIGDDGAEIAVHGENPQAFMDYWCDWHETSAQAFPDGRARVPVAQLMARVTCGAWDLSQYATSVVIDKSWAVYDDYRGAMSALARFADETPDPSGYDAIIIDFHV